MGRHAGRRMQAAMPAQPEGQDEQGTAENQRIRAQPPGKHQRADHRAHEQQQAIEHGNNRTEDHKPAPVANMQAEGGPEQQAAGDQCPDRDQKYKDEHGNAGQQRRGDADHDSDTAH